MRATKRGMQYRKHGRILRELLENTNATRYSVGILWYSRTFAEFGALAQNLLVRILVLSCAFLMYSVEYGRFREMCRIRVRIR